MQYTLTGACPRCGAPIFQVNVGTPPTDELQRREIAARIEEQHRRILDLSFRDFLKQAPLTLIASLLSVDGLKPAAYFTCTCRATLPEPLPELDGNAIESTEKADRKFLASHRPKEGGESASEERVDDRH